MIRTYLALICAAWLAAGCLSNPRLSAEYTERTNQSSIAVNQSAAQISQAQQANDEARRAQERLQALQAQQAIVQGQQAIAEANARQGIAESNNAALVKVTDQIAEASKPDNTVLIVVLICSFGLAGVVIWKLFAVNTQLVQAIPTPAQSTQRETPQLLAPNYIQIPLGVQRHAQRLGGVAEFDGERWIILSPDGSRLLATQRKQLTSKEL